MSKSQGCLLNPLVKWRLFSYFSETYFSFAIPPSVRFAIANAVKKKISANKSQYWDKKKKILFEKPYSESKTYSTYSLHMCQHRKQFTLELLPTDCQFNSRHVFRLTSQLENILRRGKNERTYLVRATQLYKFRNLLIFVQTSFIYLLVKLTGASHAV